MLELTCEQKTYFLDSNLMKEKRFLFGCLVTAIWLLLCASLLFIKRAELSALPVNAWGDFLAGCFAPLAFFWLVIGYLQQGDELEQSRQALLLQAKELKASVEQQSALVEISRMQLKSDLDAMNVRFTFSFQSVTPLSKGGERYMISLGNSGAIASNIQARIIYGYFTQVIYSAAIFNKGQKESLVIDLGLEINENTNVIIEVTYSDPNGIPRISKFLMKKRSGGSLFPIEFRSIIVD